MSSDRSRYAYEDEPYGLMCLREYVIPAVVFVLLAYYLVFHVLLPMRHVNRPTRRSEEALIAADKATDAQGRPASTTTSTEHNSSAKEKKDN
jgi:hypothetical protein